MGRRSRLWAVLASAVAVVALGVGAVVLAGHRSDRHVSAGTRSTSSTRSSSTGPAPTTRPTTTADPEAAALARARTLLNHVPLPPGARRASPAPKILGQGAWTMLSTDQATPSRAYTVPGTVAAVAAFIRHHPENGYTPNCTCGGPQVKWIDTIQGENIDSEIDYIIAPYRSGVALKITAVVPWIPLRPSWTYVAGAPASVDVSVERVRRRGTHGGAPTVHRTLTGDAARRLAAVINRLQPEAPAFCSGPAIQVAESDTVIVHELHRTITFATGASNCPQFKVTGAGQKKPAYLETGPLDTALLKELGLPADYGS